MKRRFTFAISLFVIILMLVGCGDSIAFLDKPEDAVNELLSQESLMELASRVDEFETNDDGNYASAFLKDVLTSPGIKSISLDNVRSISYSISDVSENGDKATATVLITHLDISPVIDKAFEIFMKKVEEKDASGEELPENEDEINELIFTLLKQSIKEAVEKKKPTETFSKIRFDLTRSSSGYWEIDELPDDFIDKVLLMNFPAAIDAGFDNL